MHPRLPLDVVGGIVGRAALGLQRNGHVTGVDIALEINREKLNANLTWPHADQSKLDQHDCSRITEDGAEAVSLGLVHRARGWRVVRRLQREECADWLLEDQGQTVALEVSGVDHGSIAARLRAKLVQASGCLDVDQRWASVVGFESPQAALTDVELAS